MLNVYAANQTVLGGGICDEVDDVIYNSLKHFGNGAEQRYWSIVVY